MKVLDALAHTISQQDFAAMIGVSEARVSQLVSDGVLTRGDTAIEWLAAYCERLRDQAAGRLGGELGGLDLVQERAALAREQRMGIEIKNAVARGEFASIELLSEILASASQTVVERFEQLPSQLKKACPDLPASASDQVMTTIASARNEWVRATASLITAKLTEPAADSDLDPEATDA